MAVLRREQARFACCPQAKGQAFLAACMRAVHDDQTTTSARQNSRPQARCCASSTLSQERMNLWHNTVKSACEVSVQHTQEISELVSVAVQQGSMATGMQLGLAHGSLPAYDRQHDNSCGTHKALRHCMHPHMACERWCVACKRAPGCVANSCCRLQPTTTCMR
jgi:hypothetical protein